MNERHVTFDLAQIEESKRLIQEEIGSSDEEDEEEKKDCENGVVAGSPESAADAVVDLKNST